MERRQLGRDGVEVSRVVLGCGNFGGIGSAPELFGAGESRDEAFALMDAAWDVGITTFDTADAYGGGRSERWIGEWRHARGRQPTIVTKTFNPMDTGEDHGLAPERIQRQIQSSLERLGADRVDVYLAHEFDPETPLEATVAVFEELVERRLIRSYGVSNFDAEQLRAAIQAGRPQVVQNSYSLLEQGDAAAVLPLCIRHGIGYMAFGPLAGGWLAGKYRRDDDVPAGSRMALRPEPYVHLRSERTFEALDRLDAAAAEHDADLPTLAFAWLFAQPDVTAVVVGPRRPEHLEPALRGLELSLSAAEADELTGLVR